MAHKTNDCFTLFTFSMGKTAMIGPNSNMCVVDLLQPWFSTYGFFSSLFCFRRISCSLYSYAIPHWNVLRFELFQSWTLLWQILLWSNWIQQWCNNLWLIWLPHANKLAAKTKHIRTHARTHTESKQADYGLAVIDPIKYWIIIGKNAINNTI